MGPIVPMVVFRMEYGHIKMKQNTDFGLCPILLYLIGTHDVGVRNSCPHKCFQFIEILLIDDSRGAPVVLADRRCHSDDLAHHPAGAHNPDSPESGVGHTDVTPSHHQVVYIPGIQTPVRHCILFMPFGLAYRSERFLVLHSRLLFRIVQVHPPSRRESSVFIRHILCHVLLLKNHIPHQAAGLTLATYASDPFKPLILKLFLEFWTILQICPVAVDRPKAMVPDALNLLHLVPSESCLPIPFAMDYRNTCRICELDRPRALRKHGP